MNTDTEAQITALLDAPSLYPEVERKPRDVREADLRAWLDTYGEVNSCYNFYGMDRADAQPCDDWLDLSVFGRQRWEVNSHYIPAENDLSHDCTIFTRTKLTFEMFVSYWYGPESGKYLPSKGLIVDDSFLLRHQSGPVRTEPGSFRKFIGTHDTGQKLVFKQAFGDKGKQVVIATVDKGDLVVGDSRLAPDDFLASLAEPHSTWVIQDYLVQHPVMAAFNPTSLNTLRMVTYHDGKRAFLDEGAIRMGCPGALVDNAYSDGFYTNVLADGSLEESLFNFTAKSRTIHPFQDVKVPFYREAVAFVEELHSHIPELFTIGWDIAITEHGPVVIEANDGWAVFVTQSAFGHAQRPSWNRNLEARRSYEASIGK